MKRLNPLYLLLLSAVVAVFAIYSALEEEKRFEELQSQYRYKQDMALKLRALKNAYSPKRKVELLRLLRSSSVSKSGVKYVDTKERLNISGKNIDVKTADSILAKVLNGTFIVKRFLVHRQNDGVDLDMEIAWR